jgi:hypothetical protein
VGREAPTDSGPALLKRHHANALVVLEGEIVAVSHESFARFLEPLRWAFYVVVIVLSERVSEQRRAAELTVPAFGARRDLISLM